MPGGHNESGGSVGLEVRSQRGCPSLCLLSVTRQVALPEGVRALWVQRW